jgi:hypothetical protein
MEFRQCSIGGLAYSDVVEDGKQARIENGVEVGIHDFKQLNDNLRNHPTSNIIDEFLTLLAVCHTVIPERQEGNPSGTPFFDFIPAYRKQKDVLAPTLANETICLSSFPSPSLSTSQKSYTRHHHQMRALLSPVLHIWGTSSLPVGLVQSIFRLDHTTSSTRS